MIKLQVIPGLDIPGHNPSAARGFSMKSAVNTTQDLRLRSRALLLSQLRQQAASRAELAQKTGLAKSAVTTIVSELIRDGIIEECSVTAAARAGRPAILLDITPRRLFAVGLILNRSSTLLCAVDLKGNVLRQQQVPSDTFDSQDACTAWISETVDGWFADAATPRANCIGFSVGAAGPVDREHGIIRNPPDFERFHNYPIAGLLRQRYELPVSFENVAVLFAQAEYLRGTMGTYRHTLFLFWVENGIGSVILNDGSVYRGFGSFSGEIGHTCVVPGGIPCGCGSCGCLEAYLKQEAVEARFGAFDQRRVLFGEGPHAEEILDYYVQHLGTALCNAVNMLDPDSICLYLGDEEAPDSFLRRLSQYLQEHAVICQSHPVALLYGSIPYAAPAAAAVSPLMSLFFQRGGNLSDLTQKE